MNFHTKIYLTYNGETLSIREWSEKLGIPARSIYVRYKKGLSIDQVLFGHYSGTHNQNNPLYIKWNDICLKYRKALKINDPNVESFEVCSEWYKSFDSFEAWAYENGYSKQKTFLIRKNTRKGFFPDNCFFDATRVQGNRNKVTKTQLFYHGKLYNYYCLSIVLGVNTVTIRAVVREYKKLTGTDPTDAEQILPLLDWCRYEYKGELHTLTEWGKIFGMSRSLLVMRLKRGYTLAEALEIPVAHKQTYIRRN